MEPAKHDFPSNPSETGYQLFPAELENDPNVFFHGTAQKNLNSILQDGFKSGQNQASVSYARTSALALGYACNGRSAGSPLGVVIAVRFGSLAGPGIAQESFGLHIYDAALQPQVIAHCIVPADYQHT